MINGLDTLVVALFLVFGFGGVFVSAPHLLGPRAGRGWTLVYWVAILGLSCTVDVLYRQQLGVGAQRALTTFVVLSAVFTAGSIVLLAKAYLGSPKEHLF